MLALLRVITAAALAYDARVHLRLATAYDAVRTASLSQGDLFRVEAAAAIAIGVLVLIRRRPWVALGAASVAGGGLAALLLYRYVDVGTLGPLPSMYEPAWYPDKTHVAIAQGVAAVAGLALAVITKPQPLNSTPSSPD